jgi:signal transduction histidine kinase
LHGRAIGGPDAHGREEVRREPDAPGSIRPRLRRWSARRIDAVVALGWGVALEVEALSGTHLAVPRAVGAVIVALMAAAALMRRRMPLAFLIFVGALSLTLDSLATSHSQRAEVVGVYTLVVCTYAVAVYAPLQRAAAGLVVMLAGAGATTLIQHEAASYGLGAALMTAAVWTVGRLVRRQRSLSEKLLTASNELTAEQETSRALAVDAERARIARDLHLLVASLATTMVIRAEGTIDLVSRQQTAAASEIAAIEQEGRKALAQMRRILGVLRHVDTPAPRHPVVVGESGAAAAPGLQEPLLATGMP